MNRTLLLIGLGGFLGSIARYRTAVLFTRLWPSTFPFGTFAANVVGCLLIGIVYGLWGRMGWLTPEWRLFLATGFCGGYTTFSSFTYENANLLQTGHYRTFFIYTAASVILGLAAVVLGTLITKL